MDTVSMVELGLEFLKRLACFQANSSGVFSAMLKITKTDSEQKGQNLT